MCSSGKHIFFRYYILYDFVYPIGINVYILYIQMYCYRASHTIVIILHIARNYSSVCSTFLSIDHIENCFTYKL
jgi:hypothetical protein